MYYLYENLSLTHEQLHLRGNFPDFPKPQLFGLFYFLLMFNLCYVFFLISGRHQEIVVKNRQLKAEAYLNYAVNDPVLKRNSLLHKLFEGAKLTADDQSAAGNNSNENRCLSPAVLWTSEECSNEDDRNEMTDPSSLSSSVLEYIEF